MSRFDRTTKGQTQKISFQFDLAHAPEKVWRALTIPELMQEWLLPVVEQKLEKGGALRLQAPPQPGWDGKVEGRFLEIEPRKKLQYSWVVGDIDTVVTFTLTPTDEGTRLSLEHEGFKPSQKHNFGGAIYGWNLMGEKLVALLEKRS